MRIPWPFPCCDDRPSSGFWADRVRPGSLRLPMSTPPTPPFVERVLDVSPRRLYHGIRRRLFEPRRPEPKLVWTRIAGGPLAGRELYMTDAEDTGWTAIRQGTYDRVIVDRMRQYARSGGVLWDVGALVGYHTLGFATLVGEGGKVVSFEPHPGNRQRLEMNLARNPELGRRVEVVPKALSNRDGQAVFRISNDVENGDSSCSHVVGGLPPRDEAAYRGFIEHPVETVCVDTWVERHPDRVPDAMKIDVEGAEWLIFQGATRFLERHRPAIAMEVHDIRLLFHIQGLLLGLGYRLEILDEEWSCNSRCAIMAHPRC